MVGATLVLAMGFGLIAAFRFSGSPIGAGVLVFVGAWLVAIGCALQLGAIADRLAPPTVWRAVLKLAAWSLMLGATIWAIVRAPGPELLTGVMTVPILIGLAGTVLTRRERPAIGFLLVAVALATLLAPAALERLAQP